MHTLKTLEALIRNPESAFSTLFIFCDGAKSGASEDTLRAIAETRTICRQQQWCQEVIITENEVNFGLAKSVVVGITQIIKSYGRVIVLEDDLIPSPSFLRYMNFCLQYFEHEERIGSINAYINPIPQLPPYYFLKGADCWGWGTWNRAWKHYNADTSYLYNQIIEKGLLEDWDYGGMRQVIEHAIAHPGNSWHINWQASLYLKNMLGLWPNHAYVFNAGLDGTGTNIVEVQNIEQWSRTELNNKVDEEFIKRLAIEEDAGIHRWVQNYYLEIFRNTIPRTQAGFSVRKWIKRIQQKIFPN